MGEISAIVGEIDAIVGGISGAEVAAKEAGAEQGAESLAKEQGGEQEAVDADDLGVDWDEPATEEGKDNAAQEEETAAKEKEAEEAPEAKEGAGPANIRDRGAAPSWVKYPPSWEAFRGDPDADGFFKCCVCGVKKQTESALQNHVWAKASDVQGHPPLDVQEWWYPEWTSGSAKKKKAKRGE